MIRCPLVIVALLAVGCQSAGQRAESVPQGRLGPRLGMYLKIEGVRETTGKSGHQTLLVDHVNGVALDPPIDIWIDNLSLPSNLRVRISGYESGRWIGVPDEVFRAEGTSPNQAVWQFSRYFIATSVQAPEELSEQLTTPSR